MSPVFNVTVVRGVQEWSFWGFVGASSSGTSVMSITLGQSRRVHAEVTLNYTHAAAQRFTRRGNSAAWHRQVASGGEVSPGWRRLLLQAVRHSDSLTLTLTDDHATTWLDGPALAVPPTDWLSVAMPHFSTSCYTCKWWCSGAVLLLPA